MIVFLSAIPLSAKNLFVFDFDWTLSKVHTFNKTAYGIKDKDKKTLKDDLKEHTGDVLKSILEADHYIGIATYHINVASIKSYLISAGLSNEDISRIKIVVRKNECAPMIDKNSYIEKIIEHFGENTIDSVYFYEDTLKNIIAFNDYFAYEKFKIQGFNVYTIPGNKVNENIEHYYDILFKLGKSSF